MCLKAAAKANEATKRALIAGLRTLNPLLVKPLPLPLPPLSNLGSLFQCANTSNRRFFLAKLDISTMYQACKPPDDYKHLIQLRVNGVSYYIPSLPFGLSFIPIIAIETVARHLVLRHPRQVILI